MVFLTYWFIVMTRLPQNGLKCTKKLPNQYKTWQHADKCMTVSLKKSHFSANFSLSRTSGMQFENQEDVILFAVLKSYSSPALALYGY